jgi:hypothetical protein
MAGLDHHVDSVVVKQRLRARRPVGEEYPKPLPSLGVEMPAWESIKVLCVGLTHVSVVPGQHHQPNIHRTYVHLSRSPDELTKLDLALNVTTITHREPIRQHPSPL